MVRHCLWKMRATPGACIKPGCLARRPLCHKVNLPRLCSAAVMPQSKATEMWSSAAPFPHDLLWYFRHRTNEHSSSLLLIAPVKQKVICTCRTHSIMMHSLNRGFAVHCTQPLRSKYAIIIFIYHKNHLPFPFPSAWFNNIDMLHTSRPQEFLRERNVLF